MKSATELLLVLGWALYASDHWYSLYSNFGGFYRRPGFRLYGRAKAVVIYDRMLTGRLNHWSMIEPFEPK